MSLKHFDKADSKGTIGIYQHCAKEFQEPNWRDSHWSNLGWFEHADDNSSKLKVSNMFIHRLFVFIIKLNKTTQVNKFLWRILGSQLTILQTVNKEKKTNI